MFRLSSKSHWDVPIDIGGTTVHFLVSHPTPPVFDEPPAGVDFNGRRNFDEIRLWADYVTPGAGGYIYDDDGGTGGLKPGEQFVIAGDQNSDPLDGDSIPGSIQQLLDNPRINTSVTPESPGAAQQGALQGGANLTPSQPAPVRHRGLRGRRAGQPPGGLRAPVAQHADRRLGRVLAAGLRPALPAGRRVHPEPSRRVPKLGPSNGVDRRDRARKRAGR